jgi:hypothetical protein
MVGTVASIAGQHQALRHALFAEKFARQGLTLPHRSTTMPAPSGASCRWAPSPDKPRHMDVYPSRNVDTCSLRVPAPQNNLHAPGDRLRSAGAFLD